MRCVELGQRHFRVLGGRHETHQQNEVRIMNADKIRHYGDALYEALLSRTPIDPITEQETDVSIEDAYQIQLRMIQRRIEAGETIVGKKIGVTSKVVQDMLKVDQPDFGQMTSAMVFNEGEAIRVADMIAPRAEAEVAFMLKRDLEGPGVTAADVLRATDCVMPCFEIVDSRIKDWKIRIQDTVADNASCGVLTLGGLRKDPRHIDLALAGMVLEKNGEVISTSTGAAVQGSPVNAVAWLANTLGRLGIALKAGEVILSGSQSPLVPVVAGDSLTCSVGGLGGTSVRFV